MARRGAVRRRIAVVSDAIASRLWPVPLIAVIGAVVIGLALPELDRAVDPSLSDAVAAFVFSGGTDAARAVLSAIAGSLITATSLTFSLTVVALQLASSQASPRLLRMFASDSMVQGTLAVFLGTFAYALTVLRTVENATDAADAFVPRIAVTVASVLTLVSVVVLTFFLAHLARQLRVETMMRDVHREAAQTLAIIADAHPGEPSSAPVEPEPAHTVFAVRSGFLTGVDRAGLVETAREHGIVVRELRPVGASVIAGTPLARWWHPGEPGGPGRTDERIAHDIAGCFSTAYERTPAQDVGFGLRQLTDVACRALSPGVNDPTTAIHALSHISALLCDLAGRPQRPAAYASTDGVARLIPVGDDFAELVDVALSSIRRDAVGSPDVQARLIGVIDDVAWHAGRRDQREDLAAQLERIDESVAASDLDETDRAALTTLIREARSTIRRR
ncbi:DUF2254 domain-containing protein [Microbacterium xanthum]|uniref:DUF2254 domain-containing protein n=1 Tax=Microbacterium xanthum TaxID=3079794 RepID=UPI002AD5AEA7|nr:DUF2254 domain-containing protein [Microbacterium sp. KSW-48]MDZ8171489.1 DUF2254 domain-containing protein [Microbacterium sp. KSW-48]